MTKKEYVKRSVLFFIHCDYKTEPLFYALINYIIMVMKIKIGCDVVEIKKLKKSFQRGGNKFLEKIFSSHELVNTSKAENLAGIFAVKEAVIKALNLKAGDWQKIEIGKDKSGRPELKTLNFPKIISYDISISHDGEYAMAVAIFLCS